MVCCWVVVDVDLVEFAVEDGVVLVFLVAPAAANPFDPPVQDQSPDLHPNPHRHPQRENRGVHTTVASYTDYQNYSVRDIVSVPMVPPLDYPAKDFVFLAT